MQCFSNKYRTFLNEKKTILNKEYLNNKQTNKKRQKTLKEVESLPLNSNFPNPKSLQRYDVDFRYILNY